MQDLPAPLQKILFKQMSQAPSLEECKRCAISGGIPHDCCRTPGFAIYENVQLIYEEYVKHLYKSLPFGNEHWNINEFIQFYFSEVTFLYSLDGRNVLLRVYYPKVVDCESLTNDQTQKPHQIGPRIMPDTDLNLIVLIPYDFNNFFAKRDSKRATNQGCVFLERRSDFLINNANGCLLHSENLTTHITSKPINCIYFNCKLKEDESTKQEKTVNLFKELFRHFGNYD